MFAITDHADVLRKVFNYDLSSKIDAFALARNMFQNNALTPKELYSIQSKYNKPIKAAEELLDIVMKQSGNVYTQFLDALKRTDHDDAYKLIVNGSYKGTRHNNMLSVSVFTAFIFLLT